MGEKSVLIACFLWRWWTDRNKINAKDNTGGHENILSQIRYWAGEATQYWKKVPPDKVVAAVTQWQAPAEDSLKINVDGAFHAEKRKGGWGFVVRDSWGQFRGSGARALHHVASATHAEIHAYAEAAHAAADGHIVRAERCKGQSSTEHWRE
jgi:hypothetical protein